MYDELKKRFKDEREANNYNRIDEEHPLDIYIGYDEMCHKSLAIVLDGDIEPIDSTKMIEVKIAKRKDGKLYLSFGLQEDYMSDVFYKFCADIIESTKNNVSTNSLTFVLERWKRWISLFTKPRTSLLSETEVRGLLGELIFLNEFMFDKYGHERSLKAWIGIEKAHKDFEIDDTWYEVKCVKQNAITVKISSIEQLDSEKIGELIIIKIEASNTEISNHITLNKYISSIVDKLDTDNLKIFNDKLSAIGYYYDEEYDLLVYNEKGMDKYNVTEEFPTIKSKNLKDGIVRVSYELYLNRLENFKIVGE